MRMRRKATWWAKFAARVAAILPIVPVVLAVEVLRLIRYGLEELDDLAYRALHWADSRERWYSRYLGYTNSRLFPEVLAYPDKRGRRPDKKRNRGRGKA